MKSFFRSSLETPVIDEKYKEARSKSNLRLCRMKSGKYKILDYYGNEISAHETELEGKLAFIELAG